MNKNDLIQKYFKNSLSAAERKQFLEWQKRDATFAREVAEYENVQAAIWENERIALKKRLVDLEKNRSTKSSTTTPQQRPIRQMWQWATAAAILLLVGFFAIYQLSNQADSAELYATYFAPYPNAVQPVVRGEQPENLREAAFLAYENKEYQLATQKFAELLKDKDNPDYQFYYALSMLYTGKSVQAKFIFEQLEEKETQFKPQILWYSALIYLQKDEQENAVIYLEKLLQLSEKYKQKEATELLNQLK